MDIVKKYHIHLEQDLHFLKTTDLQNYFYKMENETPKTDKVKMASIARVIVYDLVYPSENSVKSNFKKYAYRILKDRSN